MTLRTITFTLIGLATFLAAQAQDTRFRDEYLKRYDPQGYANLKYAEGITEQGASLANALSSNLKNYQNLVASSDPNQILADFNAKMKNIEQLEMNFIEQSNTFAFEQGEQIYESAAAGDAEGALYGLVGTIGALNRTSQAQRELQAQKARLRKQRAAAMSEVYYKAEEYNNGMMEQYTKRAAYAESVADENYNLAFVEHLKCYGESMDRNWSSSNTLWLQNNCAKPRQPEAGIENKFIAQDVQKANIAKRKYATFKQTGNTHFKEAAIAYAASAAKLNPNAQNYYLLGSYYKEESTILALTAFLAAQQADASFFSDSRKQELQDMINAAENEVKTAMIKKDNTYLNAYLDAGLDRAVRVNGYSLLTYTVRFDMPDAMQLVLNRKVDGLTQPQIDQMLQKVIMLCAAHNSYECVQRFKDLGVNTDFKLDGESPLQVAEKTMSPDAYRILSGGKVSAPSASSTGVVSTTSILAMADSDPIGAAKLLEQVTDEKALKAMVKEMVWDLDRSSGYIKMLGASPKAKQTIEQVPEIKARLWDEFEDAARYHRESKPSMAHLFLSSGLIKLEKVPTLSELREMQNSVIQKMNDEKLSKPENAASNSTATAYSGSLTEAKMLDLLIENIEGLIVKMKDNQYATTAAISNLNNTLKIWQDLKVKSNLSAEDKHLIHAGMYGYINHDRDGLHASYAVPVYEFLTAHYGGGKPVSTTEKLDVIIQGMRTTVAEGKAEIPESAFDFWEGMKKNGPTEAQVAIVNSSYANQNIYAGKKVEQEILDQLVNKKSDEQKSEVYLKSLNDIRSDDNISIAFRAYNSMNTELFKVLDEQFDLSKVMETENQSLFEAILMAEGNRGNMEKAGHEVFYSRDFDYTKPIGNSYPLNIYIRHTDRNVTERWNPSQYKYRKFMEYLKEVEANYGVNLVDVPVTNNGGTLLHLFVEMLANAQPHRLDVDPFLVYLEKSRANRSATDKRGQTAYDLFATNKREVYEALERATYSDNRAYKDRVVRLLRP